MSIFLSSRTGGRRSVLVLVLCLAVGSQSLAAGDWTGQSLSILQAREDGQPQARLGLNRVPGLMVRNTSFERGPFIDAMPSTDVTFELLNNTLSRYKDIVFEVSVIQGAEDRQENTKHRVIVGPLTVRTNFVLEAGYTMIYEIRFRNLAADCNCDVSVDIVSAVPVGES